MQQIDQTAGKIEQKAGKSAESCNKPAASRNKREGDYAGRSRYYPAAGEIGQPHHCRAGGGAIRRTSLREWSRA